MSRLSSQLDVSLKYLLTSVSSGNAVSTTGVWWLFKTLGVFSPLKFLENPSPQFLSSKTLPRAETTLMKMTESADHWLKADSWYMPKESKTIFSMKSVWTTKMQKLILRITSSLLVVLSNRWSRASQSTRRKVYLHSMWWVPSKETTTQYSTSKPMKSTSTNQKPHN